jgi:hypothetical protein
VQIAQYSTAEQLKELFKLEDVLSLLYSILPSSSAGLIKNGLSLLQGLIQNKVEFLNSSIRLFVKVLAKVLLFFSSIFYLMLFLLVECWTYETIKNRKTIGITDGFNFEELSYGIKSIKGDHSHFKFTRGKYGS